MLDVRCCQRSLNLCCGSVLKSRDKPSLCVSIHYLQNFRKCEKVLSGIYDNSAQPLDQLQQFTKWVLLRRDPGPGGSATAANVCIAASRPTNSIAQPLYEALQTGALCWGARRREVEPSSRGAVRARGGGVRAENSREAHQGVGMLTKRTDYSFCQPVQ